MTAKISNCEFGCTLHKVRGVVDVAAYSITCPVHGWRFKYDGPVLKLKEYAEIDDAKETIRLIEGGNLPSEDTMAYDSVMSEYDAAINLVLSRLGTTVQ